MTRAPCVCLCCTMPTDPLTYKALHRCLVPISTPMGVSFPRLARTPSPASPSPASPCLPDFALLLSVHYHTPRASLRVILNRGYQDDSGRKARERAATRCHHRHVGWERRKRGHRHRPLHNLRGLRRSRRRTSSGQSRSVPS